MTDELFYSHPVDRALITKENYRDIANDLFICQLKANVEYHSRIAETGWWSDDDTDYITSGLDATASLMAIAYDGNHQDLIDFLFTPRRDYDHTESKMLHMPLHSINSGGGGLCNELELYIVPLDEEEDIIDLNNRGEEAL